MVLRAWLLQHQESGFSCGLQLLVVAQSHLRGIVWSSFCLRCCARRVRPSAASGGFSIHQASPSLVQRWNQQSVEEASEGSVSFPWFFFSPSGEVLSVVLRMFRGCPSRGFSFQSWTCAWRYSRRYSPCSGRWPLALSWTFGLDIAVIRSSGGLSLGCWPSIPLSFGSGG